MNILKRSLYCLPFVAMASILIQCKNNKQEQPLEKDTPVKKKSIITKSDFGTMPDGTVIEQYTLRNANDVEMTVITYGGRITSLKVPNKENEFENVILGFDNLEDYLKDNPFFGALIGRYGNRIAKGKFTLDGKDYSLATNDGSNHLHGGVKGFDCVVWKAEPLENGETPSLKLTYLSKDGEEGYPGNLEVTVIYTLTQENALEVSYEAKTDKMTVVNLTQHSYFNLTGDFSKTILDQEIMLNADAFLPVDATLIPTGKIRPVVGTPFDFRSPKPVGQDIHASDEQVQLGKGFDHCWVLNGIGMRMVASAYDKASGRFMEVYTEEPGIQFYTGNFLDGTLPMPGGGAYAYRTGFCLETQHYPNSPNQPTFPSTTLKPGEIYKTKTVFKFLVK